MPGWISATGGTATWIELLVAALDDHELGDGLAGRGDAPAADVALLLLVDDAADLLPCRLLDGGRPRPASRRRERRAPACPAAAAGIAPRASSAEIMAVRDRPRAGFEPVRINSIEESSSWPAPRARQTGSGCQFWRDSVPSALSLAGICETFQIAAESCLGLLQGFAAWPWPERGKIARRQRCDARRYLGLR